jgi:hypothetical protein
MFPELLGTVRGTKTLAGNYGYTCSFCMRCVLLADLLPHWEDSLPPDPEAGASRATPSNVSVTDGTEARRKEIFRALVDAQDQEMPVDVSRKVVAEWFGVSEDQVRLIEREGLDNRWPPLEGPDEVA